ncbi:hypothetical protein DSC45_34125 [Streptomyces sp. YIM 130001]|nr:hypothetical protein DSC45_34125 [Streptomyces sp. YIM 130001]
MITLVQGRMAQLKAAKDAGMASTELAIITGGVLLMAAVLVGAIRGKLLEKIGIIDGA